MATEAASVVGADSRSTFDRTSSHGRPGKRLSSSARTASWSETDVPHRPDMSVTNKTAAGRCASEIRVSLSEIVGACFIYAEEGRLENEEALERNERHIFLRHGPLHAVA